MSIYAIGDIHGNCNKLANLFKKIPLKSEDVIVFLGDYVDRGDDSKKVIDELINFSNSFSGEVIFIRGNHEDMLLNVINNHDSLNMYSWLLNGGDKTMDSYGMGREFDISCLPKSHESFLASTQYVFIQDSYFFSHAGINPISHLERQTANDLTWNRIFFDYPLKVYPAYTFVFGHTPSEKVMFRDNKICLDTGACYGNKLSAIRLPDLKIFQS